MTKERKLSISLGPLERSSTFTYDAIPSEILDWNETVKNISSITGKKGKELFMPLRCAITGQTKGPELDRVVNLIGTEQVQKKLKEASEL